MADPNLADPHSNKPNKIRSIGTLIASITGVLIVVPALINAAGDIWVSWNNLPRTPVEATNVELFQKYIGEEPLFRGKIPIESQTGKVEMELAVYGGGDIFIRYGDGSRWFRSPLTKSNAGLFSIGRAFAQNTNPKPTIQFRQLDTINNGIIVRQRFYSNGSQEVFKINPATGSWSKQQASNPVTPPPTLKQAVPVFTFPKIDLTKMQALPQG